MKRSFTPSFLKGAVFVLALVLSPSVHAATDKSSFVSLFDGTDLSHFDAEASRGFWRIEDGVLIGTNDAALTGNYLTTKKAYRDFILEFDVRWKATTPRGIDTGVEMRSPPIQLQLGVSGSLRVDMSGSFYTGGKPAYPEEGQAKDAQNLMKPEGEWNTFRVQARGDTFTCWINGVKASEYANPKFADPAPLRFQIHPDVAMECEYRNIKIAGL